MARLRLLLPSCTHTTSTFRAPSHSHSYVSRRAVPPRDLAGRDESPQGEFIMWVVYSWGLGRWEGGPARYGTHAPVSECITHMDARVSVFVSGTQTLSLHAQEVGIGCELNLLQGSMTVHTVAAYTPLCSQTYMI